MIISDARNDSQTPFIPRSFASTTAQTAIATAPRSKDPMIAGRAFAVAEKYATSMIFTPANRNPRKYKRSPVCAYFRRSRLFSLLKAATNGSVNIHTSETRKISTTATLFNAQPRSFFTSSNAPLPKLSLISGCAPCAIPFIIAIPTSDRFATTP